MTNSDGDDDDDNNNNNSNNNLTGISKKVWYSPYALDL
jgi:hypothetical protein